MFNLFGRNKNADEVDTEEEISISKDDSEWDKNLSWSDDLIPEEIYVKGYKDNLDVDKINVSSTNAAIGSNKIYSTLPKDDTNLIILVRKMESFPSEDEIAQKRQFYKETIQKLEQAKDALAVVTSNQHDANPALTMAYTTIDSDLRHVIVEQRSFEAKLRVETQVIEDFMEIFGDSGDYKKVELLASFYGFSKSEDDILVHKSQSKPKVVKPETDLKVEEKQEEEKTEVDESKTEEVEDKITLSNVAIA